jgi:hypothetical protein
MKHSRQARIAASGLLAGFFIAQAVLRRGQVSEWVETLFVLCAIGCLISLARALQS